MSLFPEIMSSNYSENIEGFRIEYRYFVNDQDQWWYCYDDIVYFIKMNENYAEKLYYKISEDNKEMFDDWNNYDNYGKPSMTPTRFVTSEVVRDFIKRNNKRNNVLIKSMNNLEFKMDANEKYSEEDELVDLVEIARRALENKDYEDFCYSCYNVIQTDSARDILDKMGIVNKDLEKAVDNIREALYKDEIEWLIAGNGDNETIKLSKETDVWNTWFNK